MPILGNLSDFPLPEVFLLIGPRTGRLRLLDIPQFGIMDIDFSNGEVQSMHTGNHTYTDPADMVPRLSEVVQSQGGMFEFKLAPVASISREKPLLVNSMVMSLVCHVDHQMALRRKGGSGEDFYLLEDPQPEIWVEPELNDFFLLARQYLTPGVKLAELSNSLGLNQEETYTNLTNLRLLGVVKTVNAADTGQINQAIMQEEISRKSNEFLRASRAATQIKHVTASLPKLTQL